MIAVRITLESICKESPVRRIQPTDKISMTSACAAAGAFVSGSGSHLWRFTTGFLATWAPSAAGGDGR